VVLERPTQPVVKGEALEHLPRVLGVKANRVVGENLLVIVRTGWLTRVAQPDAQGAAHRKLQQVRNRRSGPASFQTGRERGVERRFEELNRSGAEEEKRSFLVLIPRAVSIAVLPIAAEAPAVSALPPVYVVCPLVRARVTIWGYVNAVSGNEPAVERDS